MVIPPDGPPAAEDDGLPFPGSLCHRCAAPPRYIRTERSVFVYCPIFRKYPPQPVGECERFVLAAEPVATARTIRKIET